jgi:hypothetical protein
MNKESNTTDKLIQKIVDRQAELTALSTTILKHRIEKKESKTAYSWFEQFKEENNFFKLSKAV